MNEFRAWAYKEKREEFKKTTLRMDNLGYLILGIGVLFFFSVVITNFF